MTNVTIWLSHIEDVVKCRTCNDQLNCVKHIAEQIPPSSTWGYGFLVAPFKNLLVLYNFFMYIVAANYEVLIQKALWHVVTMKTLNDPAKTKLK